MLITQKKELEKFYSYNRVWQGIPGIEVTKNGRVFSTFYSGGTKEEIGNYVLLLMSEDGCSFGEPIAVAYSENHRCYDPCLWIDPFDRLWLTWAYAPDNGVYGTICTHPDADVLCWSEVFRIGEDVMMNKPTILSTGEWLFPIAVWRSRLFVGTPSKSSPSGAFVYKTIDNGVSFERLGGADVKGRAFDEHMVVEGDDGVLAMYVRTSYGIGVSYSYDKGYTWTDGRESGIYGPSSRFCIRKLNTGELLLVYNKDSAYRRNLSAMLSVDGGATFKYCLTIDERDNVSYPDIKQTDDGFIHITYDRGRGSFETSLENAYKQPREILYAKVTREDIINGSITSRGSFTKRVISALGEYKGGEDLYAILDKNTVDELNELDNDTAIAKIFNLYKVNCLNLYRLDCIKLDELIEKLDEKDCDRKAVIREIISVVKASSKEKIGGNIPIVDRVKKYINENVGRSISVEKLALELGLSKYYLIHIFKKETGVSIKNYERCVKLSMAKTLLVNTDKTITEIALECGFESPCYFSKMFIKQENVSPGRYRQLLKNNSGHEKDVIFSSMLEHITLLDKDMTVIDGKSHGGVETFVVTLPCEKYAFLHEAAIIEHKGVLFAAWYNNSRLELRGETPIRFSRSFDKGQTWETPTTVANDETGGILFCPPVFLKEEDRLYMMLNTMVAPDHIHSLDLYIYNDETCRFEILWTRPIPFKLNTNVYKLADGRLILPGRVGELDGFPNIPSVLISDSGRVDDIWRMVKFSDSGRLADGSNLVHSELSLVVGKEQIYAFCRNDTRKVPILYISEDGAESWRGPIAHDIPFTESKIYSGTLSNGVNYVIGNIEYQRSKLAIYFSQKDSFVFDRYVVLQEGFNSDLGLGGTWHYPAAHEYDGYLYIIYTVSAADNTRGAVVTKININEILEA